MKIKHEKIENDTITLYENLENKNMIGRSIYSIKIENDQDISIIDLGNDKKKALLEFEALKK